MNEGLSKAGPAVSGALFRKLTDRQARIGIIGLGYVGLPLVRAFHEAGFAVTGFDTDPEKPSLLAAGRSYIMDVADREVAAMTASGRFEATDDFTRLREADAVAVCVPTPLGADREPDLRFVEASARAVAATLRPGQLVVLESTTWPGSTDEVVKPILEAGGLCSGRDFFLAYAPERESPGSGKRRIPRVIGADGPEALALARALYEAVSPSVHAVSSPAAAEAAKLTENVFRAVNIALVNELKGIYAAMGVDIWEVVEAASTKPFGYMPFWPGPGWGGHCIPIDPFYLAWKARGVGLPSRFIELAGEINAEMPERVVARLAEALAPAMLAGSRVLLVGIAYKTNID
ncbi:MAG: nucleotide sugar dehydrogenase, partial [Alphaproteobacteria bacterium]|nr:nucleotide sugar dehydrogenase [Alphaproteobacteria bacterium]